MFVILFYNRSREDRAIVLHKLFSSLVIVNIVIIIIDLLGWAFNGLQGEVNHFLNITFNFLLFFAGPLAPSIWLFYLTYLIFNDKKKLIKTMGIFTVLVAVNAFFAIASLFNGWFFYTDELNVFHRGSLYIIHPLICYSIIAYSILLVIVRRNRIEKRYFLTLLLFFVPVLIGTFIQVLFYGYSLTWVGMAVSIIIIFINIQNRSLHMDMLTGAYNRRQLAAYLGMKERTGEGRFFSAIVLDFDCLKKINDGLGHAVGDEALVETVKIINKNLSKGFVSRFGGDEFVIILESRNADNLTLLKDNIMRGIEEFNSFSGKPYKIEVSMGAGIYSIEDGEDSSLFLKKLDQQMYENKKLKKISCNLEG